MCINIIGCGSDICVNDTWVKQGLKSKCLKRGQAIPKMQPETWFYGIHNVVNMSGKFDKPLINNVLKLLKFTENPERNCEKETTKTYIVYPFKTRT